MDESSNKNKFLSITNESSYNTLDDSKTWLKKYFHEVMLLDNMTQTRFSKLYAINEKKLSDWLNNGTTSPTSRDKVFRYIRWWIDKPIIQQKITPIQKHVKESYSILCSDEPRTLIIWVDGDNCRHCLKELEYVTDIHVFCVLSIALVDRYLECQEKSWITFIPTFWASIDAADHTLSMEVTRFHFMYQKNVPFVLVSGDNFLLEVTDRLRNFGRTVIGLSDAGSILYRLLTCGLCRETELSDDFKSLTEQSTLSDIQSIYHKHNIPYTFNIINNILLQLKGEFTGIFPSHDLITLSPERIIELSNLLHEKKVLTLKDLRLKIGPGKTEEGTGSWS